MVRCGGRLIDDVVHHPANHPYVHHVSGRCRTTSPGVWDAGAVAASGASIIHLHFGFEHLGEEELAAWLDDLHAHHLRLVLTVHDLDNPHLVDQRPYRRLLGRLIARADALITLTTSAATVLAQDHGRAAAVIPHPHVVPLSELQRRPCADRRRRGVYVHAATCRPNLDVDLVEQVAAVAQRCGGVRLHLRAPLSPVAERLAASCRGRPGVELDVRARLTDRQLWDRLEGAAAVLLPYRWGTHSGLLEAAADLGTPCVAPPIGGFVDQGATALDPDDLVGSVRRAAAARPDPGRRDRAAERRAIVTAHERVYDTVRSSGDTAS